MSKQVLLMIMFSLSNKVVSIDLEAKFELNKDSFGSSYTTLASIERGGYKYGFFYVNNKSGSLAF